MDTTARPLADITLDAIQILSRELGIAETARFLGQYGNRGNYTEDRREYVDDWTIDQIMEEARKLDHSRKDEAEWPSSRSQP